VIVVPVGRIASLNTDRVSGQGQRLPIVVTVRRENNRNDRAVVIGFIETSEKIGKIESYVSIVS
jgi:hypothetical protein